MKFIKQWALVALLVIVSQSLIAQSFADKEKKGDRKAKMEQVKAELNLSPEQAQQWDTIHASYSERIKPMRKAENPDRQAIKQLRRQQKEEINSILSAEQIDTLKQLKKKRGKKGGKQRQENTRTRL